jgi:CHAD domain-containing protein
MDTEREIAPTPSLSEYAGQMLKQRLARMLSHGDGVREGVATGPVHQMRVWSRRTRAALELFHTCFEGNALTRMEREIKRVADALGEARDLDVMIEKMRSMSASLPEAQRPGVSSFIEALVHDRAACQSAVDKAVARLQRFDLGTMLDTIIAVSDQQPVPVGVELLGRIT